VSAGSNPAGGTGQRHKFEHSDNLRAARPRACDLPKRRRVPDLAPGPPPQAGPQPRKPSSAAKPNDGHQAVAPPAGRCSPPSIRSSTAAAATARQYPGRLPSPPDRREGPWAGVSHSVTSGPHPHAPDPFRRGCQKTPLLRADVPVCPAAPCGRADRGVLARMGRLRWRIRGSSGQPHRAAHRCGARLSAHLA
jgi:hypothetical protein